MNTMDTMEQTKAAEELNEVLDGLVNSCTLKTVGVVTRDGSLVTVRGDTTFADFTALAALLGGMFSATREVARMLGEDDFSVLLQQGTQRHIHISLISHRFMMICVFEDISKIGMLRVRAKRIADQVRDLATAGWIPVSNQMPVAAQSSTTASDVAGAEGATAEPQAPAADANPEFREYALDLIDRIFS